MSTLASASCMLMATIMKFQPRGNEVRVETSALEDDTLGEPEKAYISQLSASKESLRMVRDFPELNTSEA
jgi:hypothetical protein